MPSSSTPPICPPPPLRSPRTAPTLPLPPVGPGEGVELFAQSCFSFLEAASPPDDLVLAAAAAGLSALAITDRNSLAGVVRAHKAAKSCGLRLVIGALLVPLPGEGPPLLCHPSDQAAYGRLCRLLTRGRRAAPKGDCALTRDAIAAEAAGQWLTLVPPPLPCDPAADPGLAADLGFWREVAGERLSLAVVPRLDGRDPERIWHLSRLSTDSGVPLLAAGGVRMASPADKPVLDVLTCLRHHCTLDEAGARLEANAEAHIKTPGRRRWLFAACPDSLERAATVAEDCRFSLDVLRHAYPADPSGEPPQARLARLTRAGAEHRYPAGVPDRVQAQITHELRVIDQLDYARYFLTVHDIVAFARARGILCQGRGSAANSAVCFCLGITAVDPARSDMLFERFISAARNEPPDIDVDFEHDRREEVIQHLYATYGRDHAALAATVVTWRARSALREVGKVLGLSADVVGRLAGLVWGASSRLPEPARLADAGLDPDDPRLRLTLSLADRLIGLPRHLSQHVGGFVLTGPPLSEVVPIENAAMADRTILQWDKDDLDTLGILKIDILALGMLSCLRRAFDLVARHHNRVLSLATIPAEDPATYDMLCQGDSLGVFQVESRAQMAMLPRLRPRTFYDLVIEVAIVRPGPIQGDMVHPYLRRRRGEEPVIYPSPALRRVLEKTLGVPLFQEQAMRIAIEGAGFTPEEADALRRAMAAFRRAGAIQTFRTKFLAGMTASGHDPAFADQCFRQIEGFGEYGFPESHAASFALLVYVSAWLKRHYPAAFACALLNSQPMGFYAPAQIVADARRHGVEIRPVDINRSDWDHSLEPTAAGPNAPPGGALSPSPVAGGLGPSTDGTTRGDARVRDRPVALRLGLRQIRGLSEAAGRAVVAARGRGYADPAAVWRRTGLAPAVLERLARADVFAGLGLSRREALWAVKALTAAPLPLFEAAAHRLSREAGDETGPPPLAVATGWPAAGDGVLLPPADGFGPPRPPADRLTPDLLPADPVVLPPLTEGEAITEDHAALRLSLGRHPLALLRPTLAAAGIMPCADLLRRPTGARGAVAGLVICRQRPGSASGVVFVTLDDETGIANLILWPAVFDAHRRAVMAARLMVARGRIQRESGVCHLIVEEVRDRTGLLTTLARGMDDPTPDRCPHGPAGGSAARESPRRDSLADALEPARADRMRHTRPDPAADW